MIFWLNEVIGEKGKDIYLSLLATSPRSRIQVRKSRLRDTIYKQRAQR